MKITRFSPDGTANETPLDFKPLTIASEPPPPVPKAVPGKAAGGCTRPWYNEEQNSRCPFPLPEGRWVVKWSAKLRQGFPPAFVLQSGERILVEAGVWQLFDRSGKLAGEGRAGPSHLSMESDQGLFFHVNSDGELAAQALTDGRERFNTLLQFADEYVRRFFARRGSRVLLLGNERQLDPHMHYLASRSLIGSLDLSELLAPAPASGEASARNTGSLMLGSTQVVAAASGNRLVVAAPDHLIIFDLELKAQAAFSGKFNPQAISLDEAGRAYLLVVTGQGQSLWVVSPAGRRELAVSLPAVSIAPPIIGWDHRIYLSAQDKLLVISPAGAMLPEYKPGAQVAGATITADDQLLVAAGTELVAFPARSREEPRRVLFNFGGQLLTPPVLTAGKEILAATATELCCLAIKQ
jgi:hypothetical protein